MGSHGVEEAERRGGCDGGNRAPPGVGEGGDLTGVLRERLGVKEMPAMAVMMPGIGIGNLKGVATAGAGKGEEKKAAEKTVFDVKLQASTRRRRSR